MTTVLPEGIKQVTFIVPEEDHESFYDLCTADQVELAGKFRDWFKHEVQKMQNEREWK